MRSLALLVAAVVLAFAGPAFAQSPIQRAAILSAHHSVSPPPPATYDPKGVTFMPEASLVSGSVASPLALNANGGTDTTHMVVSWRERAQYGSSTGQQSDGWTSMLSGIFGNTGTSSCSYEACAGFVTVPDNANWSGAGKQGVGGTLRFTGATSAGVTGGQPSLIYEVDGAMVNNTWKTYLYIADTSGALNSKKTAFFIDGVQQTVTIQDGAGSLATNWNTALGFQINGITRNSGNKVGAFDLADLYINTADAIPAACLTSFSSPTCLAFVAKFSNGATPVDLGSSCTGPTGNSPDVCLRGDKTTFATNAGNGHALSLANQVTGSAVTPALYNPPYSAGNIPSNRPYFVWASTALPAVGTGTTNSFSTAAGGTAATSGNFGNGIQAGDLLFLDVTLCYLSINFNTAIQTPSGWTLVPTTTAANPYHGASQNCDYAEFYRVIPSTIVAENTDWTNSNGVETPPTVNWTAQGTTALRSISYTLSDYRNANATTPIQASDAQVSGTVASGTASVTAPSVTATAVPSVLVTTCHVRAKANSLTAPTGQDLRRKSYYDVTGNPFHQISDEVLASTGATGPRSMTDAVAGYYYCSDIIVQH